MELGLKHQMHDRRYKTQEMGIAFLQVQTSFCCAGLKTTSDFVDTRIFPFSLTPVNNLQLQFVLSVLEYSAGSFVFYPFFKWMHISCINRKLYEVIYYREVLLC